MKREASHTSDRRSAKPASETRTLVTFIAISAVLHLALMAGIVLLPALAPAKRYIPTVVNVSLVSLPAQGSSTVEAVAPEIPAATPPPPVEAEVKVEPVKPPTPPPPPPKPVEKVAIDPAPKASKKVKESLKHKTFKPSNVVKESVSKLAKEVEEKPRPSKLDQTLQRLKREVERSGKNPRAGRAGPAGTPDGRPGRTGLTSAQEQDRVRIYQAEIAYQVQKNWAFSEQLAGGREDLEVALGIKILADGEIEDIWFDKRSGNRHLDESAYRAIVKSNPLPALPQGLFGSHYTVGLRFGPSGIK